MDDQLARKTGKKEVGLTLMDPTYILYAWDPGGGPVGPPSFTITLIIFGYVSTNDSIVEW